jgi:beta-glucanase (GH16 family)
MGRKRGPTGADSRRLRSYQMSQSNILFYDDFSNAETFRKNWSVFTDDRYDLAACRSAASLALGPDGLSIDTVPAVGCHDHWSTGEIISRQGFLYGYFEAYIRAGAGSGLDNAFWLTTQNGSNDGSGDEFEIDIGEGIFPNDVHMTLHRHNLPQHREIGELGFDHRASETLSDQYNYYAALWTQESITFGFNGTALGVIDTGGVITGPANIHLSSALARYFGPVPENPAGLDMHVKHVRVLAV